MLDGREVGEVPREVRDRRMEWMRVRMMKVRGGGMRPEERRRTEGEKEGRAR